MNDYWKEMLNDFLTVGLKTFGFIATIIIIIGIIAKVLEWFV